MKTMKLSKAQQAVVERLKGGMPITFVKGLHPYVYIASPQGQVRVRLNTFEVLRDNGIIRKMVEEPHYVDYYLTNHPKTANNENSNTGDTTE